MAWQDRTALVAAPDDADEVILNDVSDTTDNAAGTIKRNAFSNFLASFLRLAGGTMTGNIDCDGNEIQNAVLNLDTNAELVSGDANNMISVNAKIWVGTTANLPGSPDAGTLYGTTD